MEGFILITFILVLLFIANYMEEEDDR